jgi:hypothetical protein
MKSLLYKEKTNTRDLLLYIMLNNTEQIRNPPSVLERAMNLMINWARKCIIKGAQFEHLFHI